MIVTFKPFTAHADDSGKKQTKMLVVAGYLADSARWAELEKRWFIKTKKRGLREFHRADWDLKKYGNDFLIELGDLIYGYTQYGFAYFIYCRDWEEVAKDYALELFHALPYPICARACIGTVREWCATYKVQSDRMAYIFDKGSENAGELNELLKIDESRDARGISFTPDDSDRIAGLQASDFLAWEMRNQFLNVNDDPHVWGDLTPDLAHLLKGPAFQLARVLKMPKFGFYRKADLIKLCNSAKIPLIKDVPDEVWKRKKPIRLKWPPTKP